MQTNQGNPAAVENDEAVKEREATRPFVCGVVEGFYGRPWTADQRRDLFVKMRQLGMNTYLYAPKDDLKHRAEWRLLYTSEEIELLQSLIQAAKQQGVTFVYALSPGIDIVYSSEKEVKAIQDKLDQVRCLGCEAFALLFDDIETVMNDQDKKKFPSFVMAQLTVSNAVFEYLKCPQFYFCPTEYCESRANPSLEESDYLNTLGKKLLNNIYILWTGPRVVSRYITVEHVRRVAAVLKRKPMIWDNLHANDYDPKRIFLGPYAGRSVQLKEEISGILLNPNCRYEANFVPFHTMAEWNGCHADAEVEEEVESDAILEAGDVAPVAAHIVQNASPRRLYHPLKALDEGVKKWIDHFTDGVSPTVPPISQMETHTVATVIDRSTANASIPPPMIRTCEGNELLPSSEIPSPLYTSPPIGSATTVTVQTLPISDAFMGSSEAPGAISQTVNSLSVEYSEPMDLVSMVKDETKACVEMADVSTKAANQEMLEVSSDVSMESSVFSEPESIGSIDVEQVSTLIDMFYLPFEHGRRGIQMLVEFSWLHENSFVVRRKQTSDNDTEEENLQAIVSEEWKRRSCEFLKCLRNITKLYQLITDVPNKSVVQELFQYVYDAQGVTSILEALILWMAEGELNISPAENSSFWSNGVADVEPWTLGGGLLSDLQKLLFTSPYTADLLLMKSSIPLSLSCYSIRPYKDGDEKELRCLYNPEEDSIPSDIGFFSETKGERFFDRYIGPFVKCCSPRTSFLALEHGSSNTKRIIAIASAALDAKHFAEKMRRQYIPKMRSKYNLCAEADKDHDSCSKELERLWQRQHEEIADWEPPNLSSYFYEQFPSQVDIRCRSVTQDAVAVKRLIYATAVALSFNGSNGFFVVLNSSETEKIDLCSKLGLATLKDPELPEEVVLMGHSL